MIRNKMEWKDIATPGKRTISLLFSRPDRGISRRFALGAAIIGGVTSLGGNLTLLFLTGTPGISSLIILICWLTSIVVLSFRIPWGLLLSTILGGIILLEFLTTPYVIEHLSNPDDPNGGLGVFIGDILVIGCVFGLIGGNLTALLRSGVRRNR